MAGLGLRYASVVANHYITTAIDYPNAAPHMGHVLEKVLADVYARWRRLSGDNVRFQIGTDEHGIKIQRTAEKEGMTPSALVDRNVPLFIDLYDRLGISADLFIRTSDQAQHWPTVRTLWKKIADAKMLEKRSYTGLYCSGCERFLTKKDLTDGMCPDHKTAPEEVTEENYFFLLSKEREWLKNILTDGTYAIVPEFRANETLSLLKEELHDVSFSRPRSSLAWGIPVPDDPEQTMYVWCDALTNYLSGLQYFENKTLRSDFWDNATVTHVIGKDIARFHALIWPAMLKAAGITLPNTLLIHGFLTSEGQKMSKSLGNVVKPDDVLAHFGGNPDPLRFYLSHEIPVGNDGDFSWERIDALYDAALRNNIGNLLNRVLVLLKKEGGEMMLDVSNAGVDDWSAYGEKMDHRNFHEALRHPVLHTDASNKSFNDKAVWKLSGDEKRKELSYFAENLRHIALMLLPFTPVTAQKISRQLGVSYAEKMLDPDFVIEPWKAWGADKEWKTMGEPAILFPPLEN